MLPWFYMPLIYITGPSCAGKSTLAPALKSRGYEAHDADLDVCAWYSRQTGLKVERPSKMQDRPADWENHHLQLMEEETVKALWARSREATIFVLGYCDQEAEMTAKYFDKVLCLEIDEATLNTRLHSRVTTRTGYGKDPDEMANVRKRFKPKLDRHRAAGTPMIDATQPVEAVADCVLRALRDN